MKAAFLRAFGDIDDIEIGELPTPEPKENEVQIQVAFAGVNPVDWKIAQGLLKGRMEARFPLILGWDVSGTISKVGPLSKEFNVGDTVFAYCRKAILQDGTFAEYICINEAHVAKKPPNLTLAEAACIPLSALTAWQSLFDAAHLQPKDAILIHAGAGGVGSFAIQFAKLKNATVLTTASPKHHDYLKKLGADQIIDYVKENFVDSIHKTYPEGIDVAYDTLGGDTLKQSYNALKEGGRLVTLIGSLDEKEARKRRIEAHYVFVTPSGTQLKEIASLFEEGKLKVPTLDVFPLANVKDALRKSKEGKSQGKTVLKII